jgi:hypothetical protein
MSRASRTGLDRRSWLSCIAVLTEGPQSGMPASSRARRALAMHMTASDASSIRTTASRSPLPADEARRQPRLLSRPLARRRGSGRDHCPSLIDGPLRDVFPDAALAEISKREFEDAWDKGVDTPFWFVR